MSHYILVTEEKIPPSNWLESAGEDDELCYYKVSPRGMSQEELNSYIQKRMKAGLATGLLPSDLKLKAFFFDMDGTLIDQETINELALAAGRLDDVAVITEKAMRGDIEFSEALKLRVALLKGLSKDVFPSILQKMTLTKGMPELLDFLRSKQIPYYLISGGFDYFAGEMANKFGFESHLANFLREENGILTGELQGEVIDAEAKKKFVLDTSKKFNFEAASIAAVGDGANDIPMLEVASLSAGFNARPKLFGHINIYYQDSHHFLLKILKKIPLC